MRVRQWNTTGSNFYEGKENSLAHFKITPVHSMVKTVDNTFAGRAAQMKTLVAAWGYIEDATEIANWNADGIIDKPSDLLQHPILNNS